MIFIGSGKISYGKLSQALDYGALTLQIAGDFDDAMARVQEVSKQLGIYLVNSVNPFRLEGQKTIMFRGAGSPACGAAKCPIGSSCRVAIRAIPARSAKRSPNFTRELGLIDRVPRLAVINAAGANTLYELYERRGLRWNQAARPNLPKGGHAAILRPTRRGAIASALDHCQRHRNQSAGEPDQVLAGARSL